MFGLLKKPEYRRFNLKPRYWDPEKEERELREKRIKAELGIQENEEQYVPNIQFRREYEKRKMSRSSVSSARTIRLFMILLLLFIAAFYLFVKNPEGIYRLFGL